MASGPIETGREARDGRGDGGPEGLRHGRRGHQMVSVGSSSQLGTRDLQRIGIHQNSEAEGCGSVFSRIVRSSFQRDFAIDFQGYAGHLQRIQGGRLRTAASPYNKERQRPHAESSRVACFFDAGVERLAELQAKRVDFAQLSRAKGASRSIQQHGKENLCVPARQSAWPYVSFASAHVCDASLCENGRHSACAEETRPHGCTHNGGLRPEPRRTARRLYAKGCRLGRRNARRLWRRAVGRRRNESSVYRVVCGRIEGRLMIEIGGKKTVQNIHFVRFLRV